MSTAARPVASAAAHRASPRGVALAAAARPRAARVFPACRETRRASGGVGSGVVAPTRAAAEPATLETADDDDDDDDEHDDEHDDEAFSSYGDGDTIVAIATPVVPNAGGVAIIRLSGPRAVEAARAVFRPASRAARAAAREGAPPSSHTALYGVVVDPTSVPNGSRRVNDEDVDADALDVVDEVLVLPMLRPRSYTAEDVVEIHCHGGSVCVQRVLSLLTRRDLLDPSGDTAGGVRLARPGEFTLRAFLNGRLDLTQAEAVHSLVAARTERAADGALAALRGGLASPVRDARARCVDLLAELEARLDFEDELTPLDSDAIAAEVAAVRADVAKVLATARRGKLLDTGVTVAIVGKPNAGKSSLLNAWSRSERAIVTPIAGTTRDVVEARVECAGLPVTLLDTAGIRRGAGVDEVEAIGVKRSVAAAAGADAVIVVVDATEGWTAADDDACAGILNRKRGEGIVGEADEGESAVGVRAGGGDAAGGGGDEWANAKARLHKVRGTRGLDGSSNGADGDDDATRRDGGATAILAVNKTDAIAADVALDAIVPVEVSGKFAAVVRVSAVTGAGLEELERELGRIVEGGSVDAEGGAWSANQRQAEALEQALGALERLEAIVVDGNLPVDFWTIDLREAAMALGAVTGEDVSEDVLDVVFTKFCIGK
ncbi:hypothetical protein MICPUN_60555 [Micromonas commoda]|uniref:TrmE-type G domain-containing protein n=1 Tax=Micromonas commoda (strain RCC299 / NOUM17 / CCMP2709) TaxID=296587 RepID=C1FFL3_MICCC|nr:hypothetical protein MICPUN_60555 [Micromonas commoda]ACO69392.1 hypothetical protein MICPUN_60555 [Micromonas commoda]|eukprot:XP_002508134.1 hypothetical protein MICPUN_60555 [Micromonas commoda]